MSIWFSERYTKDVSFNFKIKLLFSEKSNFQKIDIYQTKDIERVLVMDEKIMLTEKDEKIFCLVDINFLKIAFLRK